MQRVLILILLGIGLGSSEPALGQRLLLVHSGGTELTQALLEGCSEQPGPEVLDYPLPRGVRYSPRLLDEDIRSVALRLKIPWVVTTGHAGGRGLDARATLLTVRSATKPGKASLRLTVAVDASLQAFLERFPQRRRVGVLLSAGAGADLREGLAALGRRLGVSVVRVPVTDVVNIGPALEQHRGQIDVLWLLPDPILAQPVVMRALTRLSLLHRLPLVAASPLLGREGVVMASNVDADAACRLIVSHIRGPLAGTREVALPVRSVENRRMADLLGLGPGGAEGP